MPREIEGKPRGISNISLYCPPTLIKMMSDLIKDGKFSSRSECIRVAIRELVQREYMFEKYYNEKKGDAEEFIIKSLIKRKSDKIIIDGIEYKVRDA